MYEHSAKELSEKLKEHVLDVVARLLPKGKRCGHEWKAGSLSGEAGRSLSVCLVGPKKGVWGEFAGNESGDILDLWAAVRSVSIPEAMKEVREYLGIASTKIERPSEVQWVRPKINDGVTYHEAIYLIKERFLTPETVNKYQVSCAGNEIVFPSYRDDQLIRIKYLRIQRDPDGKKIMRVSKDCEPCLFGWQAVDPNARKILITEGEIDAMTMHQYDLGVGCLSIPLGGGGKNKQAWIENEFDRLATYDEIYVNMDDDEDGRAAEREIMERLGNYRCRLVKLPYKDANECLKNGVTREEIQKCLKSAKSLDPLELKRGRSFSQGIKNGINHITDFQKGYALPWDKAFGTLNFRPGELTIWTGINGHGKSQLLGYIMLDQMKQGANVCIASFELEPEKTLIRMMRQSTGMRQPSDNYIDEICEWWGDKLWVFDLAGTAKADRLIEVFKYGRQRYGIDVFVIDSLMKCGFADDDYNGQKKFLDKLTDFRRDFNCHVHVVAHPKKAQDENAPPGKMDVKGVSGITDLADNCITVWRNKPKEADVEEHGLTKELQMKSDCLITCSKQRYGEWEGKLSLWFDKESLQYLGGSSERARPMIQNELPDKNQGCFL